MRRSVLVGSIAVHAALAGLLYGISRHAPEPLRPSLIEIEVVPAAALPALAAREASEVSGGALGGASAAPQQRPAATAPAAPAVRPSPAARPALAPAPAAAAQGRLAITGYDRGARDGRAGSDGATGDSGTAGLGTSDGGGLGTGTGAGRGDGAGLGALPAIPPPPPAEPPPPVESPPSKARPPRLIYPARDRRSDDAETFVARLTVDTDGYVVGARLVRGLGGQRDELASQLVWRFRYAPALDDVGRAIRATVDQRFLVGF